VNRVPVHKKIGGVFVKIAEVDSVTLEWLKDEDDIVEILAVYVIDEFEEDYPDFEEERRVHEFCAEL